MASGTPLRLDDQPRPLDYTKASKSAGVSVRKVDLTTSNETRKAEALSSSFKARKFITTMHWRQAVASIVNSVSVELPDSEQLEEFSVGSEAYHLRNQITVEYAQADHGFIAGISIPVTQEFNGSGNSPALAKANLFQQIHRQFQQLYKTQPMQRTEKQEFIWLELERLIDVEHYKFHRSTLVTCRGQVIGVNENSDVVFDWLGGSKLHLPASLLSAGWGTLEEGQWCKAVIERRAGDGKIRQAMMLCKVDPPSQISDEESAKRWSKLPAAKLYPTD